MPRQPIPKRFRICPPSLVLLEKRAVETGLKNWEQTEIVSGLQEGDTVVRSINREGVEDGAMAQIDES